MRDAFWKETINTLEVGSTHVSARSDEKRLRVHVAGVVLRINSLSGNFARF